MFLGETRSQLDPKNRGRVPAKYRAELGKTCYLTIGSNSCLSLYSKSGFEQYMSKLEEIPTHDLAARHVIRKIMSLAEEIEPDDQGRFILPKQLKEFAKIDKNIVIIGTGNNIEIWSEEAWDEYCSIDDLNKELAMLGSKYGV